MKVLRALIKLVITLLLIVPLVFWAISSLYSYAENQIYLPAELNLSSEQYAQNAEWMKDVQDDKFLSEIALPGTHDSATQYVHLPYLAQCQFLSLEDQLNAGYRYLDIRLKADQNNKTLTFHHGPAACLTERGFFSSSLDLKDGLEQCYKFLQAHPSETIVFVIKQEDSELAPSDFQDILTEYVNQNPDAWYLNRQVPTLGDARGKIVLMQRHQLDKDYKTQGPALLWKDQRQKAPEEKQLPYEVYKTAGAPSVAVQDAFQYSVDDKWKAFEASALAMSEELATDMVSLNFLSTKGPTPVGHPFGYAYDLNPKLLASSLNFAHTWTIVDFATPEIAAKIYASNF